MAKKRNNRPTQNVFKRRFYLLLAYLLGEAPVKGAPMSDIRDSVEGALMDMPEILKNVKVNGVPYTTDPEIPDSESKILLFAILISRVYRGMDFENARATVRAWRKGSLYAAGGGSTSIRDIAGSAEDEGILDNLGDFFDPSDGGFGQDIGDFFGDLLDFDGDGDINPFN